MFGINMFICRCNSDVGHFPFSRICVINACNPSYKMSLLWFSFNQNWNHRYILLNFLNQILRKNAGSPKSLQADRKKFGEKKSYCVFQSLLFEHARKHYLVSIKRVNYQKHWPIIVRVKGIEVNNCYTFQNCYL